ncbi:hypothetical protein LJR234_004271 [Mesorhizobium amorphae]|uniref:hypothetical protein n=1 Tax=Mesorhizobium amorphae TaxID=71433 RepID=UPI003ECFECF1
MDLVEADCDLEDTADDEPSIGDDDRERDSGDHEDGGDNEPMLGAAEWYPTSRERPWGRSGELTVSDDEPALGWTGHVDQR